MTSHHLCNILLVGVESPDQFILKRTAQGHEFQDTEVFGDHLRLCSPLAKTEKSKREGPCTELKTQHFTYFTSQHFTGQTKSHGHNYHMVITILGDVCAGGQSCLTLCNPMDCTHQVLLFMGILQARILEWVAISFSRASSQPKDWTYVSYIDKQILYHCATWEINETNILGEGRCNSTYAWEEKKQDTCQHPQWQPTWLCRGIHQLQTDQCIK